MACALRRHGVTDSGLWDSGSEYIVKMEQKILLLSLFNFWICLLYFFLCLSRWIKGRLIRWHL
ncbi:MAG: hypothetical protein P8X74_24025 [Reinekea sp.]